MAEYHVKINKEGNIIAGTLSKTGKWTNSSVVTEEVLAAARDHLLLMTNHEKTAISYAWSYPNGKTLLLKLEEVETEDIQKEKE